MPPKTTPSKKASPPAPPSPALMRSPIVDEELQLLETAIESLSATRPSRPPRTGPSIEEQLLALRDEIAASRQEDVPPLMAQMQRLQGIADRRIEPTEPVDRKSPYFGHLRLAEKGRPVRDVLIGKATHIDAPRGVRIVDWRHAPVSQIYYRYPQGAEYEETFGDSELEGEVLVRRTVTIIDGALERVSAPEGTFARKHDGTWRELSLTATELHGGQGAAVRPGDLGASFRAREDRHLPEIAALLDPRQFELISKPDSGIVVVQGGAGSGKTTIGVHRMAFLSFQSKVRFSGDKMLVIVGSPALRAYIGEALRSLALVGVTLMTFREWASDVRKRAIPWLEAPVDESTPSEVTRYKTHPNMLRLLEKKAKAARQAGLNMGSEIDSRAVVQLWADLLTDEPEVRKAFEANPDAEFSLDGVARALKHCRERCRGILELDPGDREERRERIEEEADDDTHGRGADGRDLVDERGVLDEEDDALLLRIHQLMRGELPRGKGPRLYEHLFVDEAQDLSATDLAVLLNVVTPSRCVTLAGDTSQRLMVESGFRNWQDVMNDLKLSHVEIEPLKIAYRSTKEVLEFARGVLGPLADPDKPHAPRSGAPVEHHHFPSAGAAAAFLADAFRELFQHEPRSTVAVLARHAEQADVYFEALQMAEIPNLRRVRAFEFVFRPGVDVTEIRQVKGLEYDYVVLVDVNADVYPEADDARYLLHIGATRAAHQLWVVSTAKVSPLVNLADLEEGSPAN